MKPVSLYKFQQFSARSVEQLCSDRVYYANPSDFNDPLDCLPYVTADLPKRELEALYREVLRRRFNGEIDTAMKLISIKGEKADQRKTDLADLRAKRSTGKISYLAGQVELDDPEAMHVEMLRDALQDELRNRWARGVFCLSSRFGSPLMWSHYACQHQGFCVEYDTADIDEAELHQVDYDHSREVLASDLQAELLREDLAAKLRIDKACLLAKAPQWKYEVEWRMFSTVGSKDSRLRLKSVIFGMRCPRPVQYAIVRALSGRKPAIKFWVINAPGISHKLRRSQVDADELEASYRSGSPIFDFDIL